MKFFKKLVAWLAIIVFVVSIVLCVANIAATFTAGAGGSVAAGFEVFGVTIIGATADACKSLAMLHGVIALLALLVGYLIAPEEMDALTERLKNAAAATGGAVGGLLGGLVGGTISGLLDGGVGSWLLLGVAIFVGWKLLSDDDQPVATGQAPSVHVHAGGGS